MYWHHCATKFAACRKQERIVAAFFDFDKTLISNDSQELEAKEILLPRHASSNPHVLAGLIGTLLLDLAVKWNWCTPNLQGRVYLSSYRGLELANLVESARRLYEKKMKGMVFEEMMDRMERHRKQGHKIVLLSATSEHLIEPFVDDCKPDAWIATRIESDCNGFCTGKPVEDILSEDAKVKAVLELASIYNIDLSQSWAYSDHHSDRPFLELLGVSVAVNPSPELEKIAKRNRWEVIRPKSKDITDIRKSKRRADCTHHRRSEKRQRKTLGIVLFLVLVLVLFLNMVFLWADINPWLQDISRLEASMIRKDRRVMMRRLCIISLEPITYIEAVSGTIVWYRRIIKGALELGIDILVVEPEPHDNNDKAPYKFQNQPINGTLSTLRLPAQDIEDRGGVAAFSPWSVRREMRQRIMQFAPEAIVIPDPCVLSFDTMMISPGYYEAQKLGATLVYPIHTNIIDIAAGSYPWMGFAVVQSVLHFWHKNTLNGADVVLAQSDEQAQHLRRQTGFAGRVDILSAGRSSVCTGHDTVPGLDLPNQLLQCNVTFSWVGRLSIEKHVREVLAATDSLLSQDVLGDKVCLVLAVPDQGELEQVQHYISRHARNIFYLGTLEQEQLGSVLQLSDAMLFVGGPIDADPIVIYDAQDCQTPVLAVATPHSTWWQNQDRHYHVDLTVISSSTESTTQVLMNRMQAFVNNTGGLKEHLSTNTANPSATSNTREGSKSQAIYQFMSILESV